MRSIIKNNTNVGAPPAFNLAVKFEETKTCLKRKSPPPSGRTSASKGRAQSKDGTTTSQAAIEIKTPEGPNVGITVSKNSSGDIQQVSRFRLVTAIAL